MNARVPARYALYIRDWNSDQPRSIRAMWAFTAADACTQFKLEQNSRGNTLELCEIEPWREEKHGPWPEELA